MSGCGINDMLIEFITPWFIPCGDDTLTSSLQSKVRTLAAGDTRIQLLFTALNFFKHFVEFYEKKPCEITVLYDKMLGAGFLLDHGISFPVAGFRN